MGGKIATTVNCISFCSRINVFADNHKMSNSTRRWTFQINNFSQGEESVEWLLPYSTTRAKSLQIEKMAFNKWFYEYNEDETSIHNINKNMWMLYFIDGTATWIVNERVYTKNTEGIYTCFTKWRQFNIRLMSFRIV